MSATVVMLLGTNAFVVGLLVWVYWALPTRTRPDLYFSVTVPPRFRSTAEGMRILQGYRTSTLWSGVVGFALAVLAPAVGFGFGFNLGAGLAVAGMFAALAWQTVRWLQAFQRARRAVRPHGVAAPARREASLAPVPARLPGRVWLYLGPFVVIGAGAAFLALRYESIPQRYAVHWNAAGHVDRWAERSVGEVFMPLAMAAGTTLLLVAVAPLAYLARRVHASGAAAARDNYLRMGYEASMLAFAWLLALILTSMAVWIPFRESTSMPHVLVVGILAATFLATIAMTAFLLRAGQGGTALTDPAQQPEDVVGDRTPDECWKWGLFYYNPEDPALWVEQRFGIGWTVNFGRPVAWWLMGGLVVVPVALALLPVWLT